MSDYSNKVAVITGAGSGIGRALSRLLAGQGCHLALADIRPERLRALLDELAPTGVNVSLHALDVSDAEAVQRFANAAIEAHTSVQLLFNNAGVALNQPVREASLADMHWLMNINYWGVVHGTQAFLPHLLHRGDGHIINISSALGLISAPTQAAYNSAKFAVRGYTECLRQELAGSGVSVSCVHPGGINTNIVRDARLHDEDQREAKLERFAALARTSPERAAEIILRGVGRKKARILVGSDARIISAISRLFPANYEKLIWPKRSRQSAR